MALLDARGKQAIRMKTQQRGNTMNTTESGKGIMQAVINKEWLRILAFGVETPVINVAPRTAAGFEVLP